MDFLVVALVLAVAVGALAVAAAHASRPEDPWGPSVLRLAPIAFVAGAVLALWGGTG
ncbi:hypothetical protein ACI79J_18330 [Geodermatophilus sp. SYSU D01062]